MLKNLTAIIISDTHSKEKNIKWFKDTANLKKVNCVIHAGDFSHSQGTFDRFLRWFSELDIEYKILIAGNHDSEVYDMGYDAMFQICHTLGIIYLQDTSVEIEGVKIHGSPWSNEFGGWSFMMDDFELDQHWQKIPDDTNVLITHGPAFKIGDDVGEYQDLSCTNVGSRTLEMRIRELKELTHHFFGHVHEGYGVHQQDDYTAYNASIMNYNFMPENEPWTFQLN